MRKTIPFLLIILLTLGCKKSADSGEPSSPEKAAQPAASAKVPTASAAPAQAAKPAPKSAPAPSNALQAPEDVSAPPENAEKTASGLASRILTAGTGDKHPGVTDVVKVHYSGWTTDGKMFDSSVKRGAPATFPLNRVIPGWTEGLQLMKTGEKRRLWIPEDLAYKGRPGRPQGMLVFDVELLEIKEVPKPPETPADLAAPPKDAERSASGLAWKILKPGSGDKTPTATDEVSVHYSGWTTDGKMFDSSVTRGSPASFPLNRVIAGWTEGVQLMRVGEKRRFWIPKDLAYQGKPGRPMGMLIFDVELLKIK